VLSLRGVALFLDGGSNSQRRHGSIWDVVSAISPPNHSNHGQPLGESGGCPQIWCPRLPRHRRQGLPVIFLSLVLHLSDCAWTIGADTWNPPGAPVAVMLQGSLHPCDAATGDRLGRNPQRQPAYPSTWPSVTEHQRSIILIKESCTRVSMCPM
jgi:hypothetical protein